MKISMVLPSYQSLSSQHVKMISFCLVSDITLAPGNRKTDVPENQTPAPLRYISGSLRSKRLRSTSAARSTARGGGFALRGAHTLVLYWRG